jgi:uracil phosphoribosyltransferase
MLMGYEATKDLPHQQIEIETPLERTTARIVSGKKLTLVPILRAGLGMVEGLLRLVVDAQGVGQAGRGRRRPEHWAARAAPFLGQDSIT